MNKQQAVDFILGFLAKSPAKYNHSYLLETDFKPHDWVVDAVIEAAQLHDDVLLALGSANGLLRSAASIVERAGKETNWEAYGSRLKDGLAYQHSVMLRYDPNMTSTLADNRVKVVYVYRYADGTTQLRAPAINDHGECKDILEHGLQALTDGVAVRPN